MRLIVFNMAMDLDDPLLEFVVSWVRALAARVEFVHVITMRVGRFEVPKNVKVYSVGKEKGYSEARRVLELYRHLAHVLRTDRIDACFAHWASIFGVLAAPILRAKRIPLVCWHAHPSLNWTLKAAHHLSNRMVTSIPTAYPYKPDKLTVIGQGIDTELFAPIDGATEEEPPMILSVGRLSPVKDHQTLLKAARLLRDNWRAPCRVVIVGGSASPQDNSYVESLRRQVRALDLEDTVAFASQIPRRSLPLWYGRSTVNVNMTPLGFGDKVALEAMACGRVCLVANEGFKDTLGKHVDSLLYPYGDAEKLAQRLNWALRLSKLERAAIGSYLRNQVETKHGLNRLAETLVRVLQSQQSAKGSRRTSQGQAVES